MLIGSPRWLTWLAGVPLLLLGIVLLLAWVLRTQYETRLRQQVWPERVPEIPVVSNAPPGAARTVLMLGDLRTAQWGLPPLSHWRVINAGADSLTTGQIRQCAPALLDRFHPDAIVLEAGINDLKYLGLRPAMTDRIVSLTLSNITAIVTAGAERHCRVIVLTTWPAGQLTPARRLVWNAVVPEAVSRLNRRLQTLDSPEKGIHVADLFKKAGLKPDANFYRDTLRLTPAAYDLLTPLLEKELDSG